MWSASWWRGAADRAAKSAAQTLVVLWGADGVLQVLEVDWLPSLGLAAGAAVLSLLTSVLSAPVGDRGSTSLLPGSS